MSEPADDSGAYFVEDHVSFTAPRLQAITNSITAFKNASKQVQGAEARIRAALTDLGALDTFATEVARLIEERAFHLLPEFARGRELFEGYHHLTVKPWRGVFLVSRDGTNVAAVIFSRHPHVFEGRFEELTEPYRRASMKSLLDNGEKADG